MVKGDISNEEMRKVYIDVDLLLQVQDDTVMARVRRAVGKPKIVLRDRAGLQFLEALLREPVYVVLLNVRNEHITEKVLEDLGIDNYNKYLHETDRYELMRIAESSDTEFMVFHRSDPVGLAKTLVFINWKELWYLCRTGLSRRFSNGH